MRFNNVVVSIHAHPDDTEAWCAGTLKLLKERGYKIVIATLTAGGMGGIGSDEQTTIDIRREEARKAAAVLDADYHCFEGRDGYLFDTEELRLKITSLVRKYKAGIVMTHLPMDYHVDHRVTCNMVEAATIVATLPNVPVEEEPLEITPLLYHTAPLTLTDPIGAPIAPPHFIVDVSSVMDTKREMLQYHQSQQTLMKVMHKMDDFFGVVYQGNKDYGKMAEVEYAEVFWQHLGGGFQKDPIVQLELARNVTIVK
ncbi:MAG: PIG-L family deacetylase [Bacteroidales bacterium]|nr:PIG-L family deacetylase [Bacteroidales bacterium]